MEKIFETSFITILHDSTISWCHVDIDCFKKFPFEINKTKIRIILLSNTSGYDLLVSINDTQMLFNELILNDVEYLISKMKNSNNNNIDLNKN